MVAGNEQPYIPEDEPTRLGRLLGEEIRLAEEIIGTHPTDETAVLSPGWGMDTSTALAFQRARTILQAVSYGRQYWEDELGLRMNLHASSAFRGKKGVLPVVTGRLLQLVALSRVPVELRDEFPIPSIHAVRQTLAEMRQELGVDGEFQRLADGPDFTLPAFPGVDEDRIMQAILDGQLRIGNPDQPLATDPSSASQPGSVASANTPQAQVRGIDAIIRRIIDTMGNNGDA